MRRGILLGALALTAVPLCAADRGDPITNFFLNSSTNSVDYQVTEFPAPHSTDPAITENSVRGNFIVSKTATDTWSVRQSVGEVELSRAPVIAQTGLSVPQSLWDIETGGAYQHRMGDRREWGASASFGSASDEPFHSIHETIFRATGTYRIPSGDRNAWLFFLSYSNNRHFANNVPLPGAAYVLRSADGKLDAALGLPFLAVNYRPFTRLSARFSIFGPENVSSELAYTLWGPVQAYGGFDWRQQEWLRANRPDNSDRLFYDQKKWVMGFRFPVYRAIRLDLSGNYGFDRRFYEDTRARNTDVPAADLNPGWAFQARITTRW